MSRIFLMDVLMLISELILEKLFKRLGKCRIRDFDSKIVLSFVVQFKLVLHP